MGCEFPVCRRCCFCLPLRRGLLIWSYLKSVASAYFILGRIFLISIMISHVIMYSDNGDGVVTSQMTSFLITPVIQPAVFFLDFVASIGIIDGGHMKNVKLLRIYFLLTIASWTLTLAFWFIAVILLLNGLLIRHMDWETAAVQFLISFMYLAIHTYVLILLRSVIIKLRNNSEFRFKNKNDADEAECINVP